MSFRRLMNDWEVNEVASLLEKLATFRGFTTDSTKLFGSIASVRNIGEKYY